jgi:hypothetical protein
VSHLDAITGDDLWVKVVEMLQQNWAAIEPEAEGVRVFFISDTSGVFDDMAFPGQAEAEAALTRNGFRRFRDAPGLQAFLHPPAPPYRAATHPNGRIYSSGRFWR